MQVVLSMYQSSNPNDAEADPAPSLGQLDLDRHSVPTSQLVTDSTQLIFRDAERGELQVTTRKELVQERICVFKYSDQERSTNLCVGYSFVQAARTVICEG